MISTKELIKERYIKCGECGKHYVKESIKKHLVSKHPEKYKEAVSLLEQCFKKGRYEND